MYRPSDCGRKCRTLKRKRTLTLLIRYRTSDDTMSLSSFSILQTVSFLAKACTRCLKRFPVTIGFVWALSAYLLVRVYNPSLIKEWEWSTTCSYYLLTGSLLSLTLHLWGEEQKNSKRVWSVFFAGLSLLLADSIYLHYQALTQELVLSRGALIFSTLLSAFILPFIKEKEDITAWNFSVSAIQAFSSALCTGVLMTGGVFLLLVSLDKLFGIEISTNCFMYVGIICNVILSPMLFLGFLPEGEKSMTTGFITPTLPITSCAGCSYPYWQAIWWCFTFMKHASLRCGNCPTDGFHGWLRLSRWDASCCLVCFIR